MPAKWVQRQYTKPRSVMEIVDNTGPVGIETKRKFKSEEMFVWADSSVHSHNYDSFRSSTIVGPSAPLRKKRSAAAHSSWTSKADRAEKGYFSYTCSSFVLPPPPPQKCVPCAPSPQWIHCPVAGAKAKSAGKGVPASVTSIQSVEESKSMQNEVEMSSVNEHNSVSGRLSVVLNPPFAPKKKHILSYTRD